MLILEIFAQRARSHEGKLQVELARLQYLSTRLVRRWTPPGAPDAAASACAAARARRRSRLDRRMIGERIKRTRERLEKVKQPAPDAAPRARAQRRLQRLAGRLHQRRQVDAVQRAGQGAAPTPPTSCSPRSTRRRASSTSQRARERVGVAVRHRRLHPRPAARAGRRVPARRLQEAADADLLLHVVDARARLLRRADRARSKRVLHEIGAADVPQMLVFNKIDRLERPSGRAACATRRAAAGRARCRASSSARSPAKASTSCGARSRRWSPGATARSGAELPASADGPDHDEPHDEAPALLASRLSHSRA